MSNQILKPIRCDQCENTGLVLAHNISWIWISHQLKAVWLENPKVASTSVKTALGIQPKGAVPGDLSNPYNFLRLPLPRDRLFKFSNYFIFGFCRNPWDRMVSTWKNFTTDKARRRLLTKHWRISQPDKLSFEQFMRLVDKNQPKVNHHWVPQSMFVPMDKIEIDFVGRIESFSEAWSNVIQRLNIRRSIGHIYTTKHNHYSTYYDNETREIVERLYSKDISLFDYTFKKEENNESI
jgi:hypothetical protein